MINQSIGKCRQPSTFWSPSLLVEGSKWVDPNPRERFTDQGIGCWLLYMLWHRGRAANQELPHRVSTLRGTQGPVGLPRGLFWLAAGQLASPFQNSFSSLSGRGQPAVPVSCMTGLPLFTSLASIQGQFKEGRSGSVCKYGLLMCYLSSLNVISKQILVNSRFELRHLVGAF